jgi:hypothetical protein
MDVKLVLHNKERMQSDSICRAVKDKVIPAHAMVAYRVLRTWLYAFLVWAVDGSGKLHAPAALSPEKTLQYTLNKRLDGLQS